MSINLFDLTGETATIRVNGHPFNDFIISRTSVGHWGDSEDLQGVLIFLSSKASDYVNGHIVYVEGAYSPPYENRQIKIKFLNENYAS